MVCPILISVSLTPGPYLGWARLTCQNPTVSRAVSKPMRERSIMAAVPPRLGVREFDDGLGVAQLAEQTVGRHEVLLTRLRDQRLTFGTLRPKLGWQAPEFLQPHRAAGERDLNMVAAA